MVSYNELVHDSKVHTTFNFKGIVEVTGSHVHCKSGKVPLIINISEIMQVRD